MITEKEIIKVLKNCSNKAIYGVQVVDGELYVSQNNYKHIAKVILDKIKEKELLKASIEKAEKDILVDILRKDKKYQKRI